MNANDLIGELAQRTGLPALRLSTEGTASLQADGATTLHIEHDAPGNRLHLYTPLGAPPSTGREACFGRLLEANLFGLQTGGGSVAFHRPSNQLLLTRTMDLESTDITALETALEQMLLAVAAVKALVDSPDTGEPASFDPRLSGLLRG